MVPGTKEPVSVTAGELIPLHATLPNTEAEDTLIMDIIFISDLATRTLHKAKKSSPTFVHWLLLQMLSIYGE